MSLISLFCDGRCKKGAAATDRAEAQQGGAGELPHAQGQGPYQAAVAQEQLRGAIPRLRSVAVAKRSYPTPEVRSGGREEQPHVQGAAAAQVQEDREELLHVHGQEG